MGMTGKTPALRQDIVCRKLQLHIGGVDTVKTVYDDRFCRFQGRKEGQILQKQHIFAHLRQLVDDSCAGEEGGGLGADAKLGWGIGAEYVGDHRPVAAAPAVVEQ